MPTKGDRVVTSPHPMYRNKTARASWRRVNKFVADVVEASAVSDWDEITASSSSSSISISMPWRQPPASLSRDTHRPHLRATCIRRSHCTRRKLECGTPAPRTHAPSPPKLNPKPSPSPMPNNPILYTLSIITQNANHNPYPNFKH